MTVVALSGMVDESVAAAERLAERGVSVEVIDPRTIAPLDLETILDSVRETHASGRRPRRAQDLWLRRRARRPDHGEAFDYLDAPVERVAPPSTSRSPAARRHGRVYPSADDVIAAVDRLLA